MTTGQAERIVARWPALDRGLWQAALVEVGTFRPTNVISTWRSRTIETVAVGYGCALAWLGSQGLLVADQPPAARWSPAILMRYAADLRARLSPATVLNRLLALERALAVLAPDSVRSALRAILRSQPQPVPRADKRSRVQDTARLVDLGYQLMASAEAGAHKEARKNAALYRDGMQIALLALRPFRMRNFAGLRNGTHLVKRDGAWWLVLQREETKTRQPIDVPFPEQLVPAMTRYLQHYRPLLAGDRYRGDYLWVSYLFKAEAAHTLQLQIVARTERAFGRSVNPHLFRDSAATSIAIHDPENIRMAATILGHRCFATTEKHYNMARTLDAGRRYGRYRQTTPSLKSHLSAIERRA